MLSSSFPEIEVILLALAALSSAGWAWLAYAFWAEG
jgi:hypothetical protein